MANGKLGNLIPSFLISEFSNLAVGQNRKLGFKNIGKKCLRFPRFSRFPSFRPGSFLIVFVHPLKRVKNYKLFVNRY